MHKERVLQLRHSRFIIQEHVEIITVDSGLGRDNRDVEMKILEDDAMSFEDGFKKEPKTLKRSSSTMADDDDLQIAEQQYRGVVYSLTKPSYILRRRAGLKNL